MKPSIEAIVGKLPSPDDLGGGGDAVDESAGVAPPDDPEGPEREEYNAAEDSMAAFSDALEKGDTAKQLDAFLDLLKNTRDRL